MADSEQAIVDEARRRRIALTAMSEYRMEAGYRPPTLILGYAQSPEPTIRSGVTELADAVRATRRQSPSRTRR